MSAQKAPQLPETGQTVTTTCGTAEKFMLNTPRVLHEGKWVFFCIPACQQEFIQNPESSSCLVDHATDDEN